MDERNDAGYWICMGNKLCENPPIRLPTAADASLYRITFAPDIITTATTGQPNSKTDMTHSQINYGLTFYSRTVIIMSSLAL